MEALSTIAETIRDLLIFVAVLTALLVVLIVVVAGMPKDNPLKRLLTALTYRVGATAAAGALAIPIESIPGLDVLYDVGAPSFSIGFRFSGMQAGRCPVRPRHERAKCPRRSTICRTRLQGTTIDAGNRIGKQASVRKPRHGERSRRFEPAGMQAVAFLKPHGGVRVPIELPRNGTIVRRLRVDRSKICSGWSIEDVAVDREMGSMAGAIPASLGRIPSNLAAQMGADGGPLM